MTDHFKIRGKAETLTLSINGQKYEIRVNSSRTLMEVLREDLRYTGTKEGCGQGQCGTCTVLIDGKPMLACILLAHTLEGKDIQTIEGLGSGEILDPIQESFIATNSVQCGFCTPGMIMSTKGLLLQNPAPTETEIKEGLSGNLCRCNSYKKIIDAVNMVADTANKKRQGDKMNALEASKTGSSVLGKSFPSITSSQKVTGQLKYPSDIYLPHMLWAKVLRSSVPHAIIKSINIDKARQLEGVKAVITGADFKEDAKTGYTIADRYPLARDKVRFYGEAIAAVAAVTEEIALKAIDLIEIEFDVLPSVFDPEKAILEDAPKVHKKGNIASIRTEDHGDVEKGFAQSDYVLESRYEIGAQEHAPLETEATVVKYEADGTFTCWASTHVKFGARAMVAAAVGLDQKDVRLIVDGLGGDFGGKAKVQSLIITVALAKKAGILNSVRYVHTRTEEAMASTIRHPAIMYIKSGVNKDGQIIARHLKLYANTGAYVDSGDVVVQWAGAFFCAVYKIPHQKFDGYTVYTNSPVGGSMRGFGGPQQTFAVESHMDLLAAKVGLSPSEIRLKNVVETGYRLPFDWELQSCGLKECIDVVIESAEWQKYNNVDNTGRYKIGRGMAIGPHGSGWKAGFENHLGLVNTDPSSCYLKLDSDGAVRAFTGETDHGTGNLTGMTQIIAEEMGVNFCDVKVSQGDTNVVPFGQGAYSSRSLMIGGMAARIAASRAKKKIKAIAADYLGTEPDQIEIRASRIYTKEDHGNFLSLYDLAILSLTNDKYEPVYTYGYYDHKGTIKQPGTNMGSISGAFLYNVTGVIVRVDSQTGQYNVLEIISASDCGFAINPDLCRAQIQGAALMGLGLGSLEDMGIKDGLVKNISLEDYKIWTFMDLPEIKALLVESNEPNGPFGAKGVAENPLIATPSALANALSDATGTNFQRLPISDEIVYKNISKEEK